MDFERLSPLRARLASFEHAYAVALRRRGETGVEQYVVKTGRPIQPVIVTSIQPADRDDLLVWFL